MKSFLKFLAVGLLAFTASDSFAQSRDLGGNRLILDDGNGGMLTMSYQGPGHSNFIIPPGGGTTVPMGTLMGQTLAWSGTEWQAMSNLLNTGGNVSMPTGNFGMLSGVFSLEGGNKPEITPTGITMGQDADLDQGIEIKSQLGSYPYIDFSMNPGVDYDVRLVNSSNDLLMIDGGDLTLNSNDITNVGTITATNGNFTNVSGDGSGLTNVSASSLVLPFSQTASDVSPLFSLTNTSGLGGAGYFAINNPVSNAAGVFGETNGGGPGVHGRSFAGPGLHAESTDGRGISASSTNGPAAYFFTSNNANSSSTLESFNEGTSHAGMFENVLATNAAPVVWANHRGLGSAGVFGIDNAASNSAVISASTAGSGSAIWGNSTSGTGGTFSGTTGIHINSGRLIASYGTVADGGTIADNVVMARVNNDGNGGTFPSVSMPASPVTGQILITTTDDPNGAMVNGVFQTDLEARHWVYFDGWKPQQ